MSLAAAAAAKETPKESINPAYKADGSAKAEEGMAASVVAAPPPPAPVAVSKSGSMRIEAQVEKAEDWGPYLIRAAQLLFLCALPAVLFGVIFTSTGYGQTIMNELINELNPVANTLLGIGFLTLLTLYLTDFSYWHGVWYNFKNVLTVLALLCCCAGAVTSAKRYPTMPLMTYLLLSPGFFAVVRFGLFKDQTRHPLPYFLSSLAPALFITGAVGIFWWWFDTTSRDELWPGHDCKVQCDFYSALQCPGADKSKPGCACIPKTGERDTNCELAAFLVWTSLFIASSAVLIFSFVIYFLSLSMRADAQKDAHKMSKNVRIFGALLCLGVLGLWIASQIGGADMALSNVVMAFSGAFLFALVCVVGASIGWQCLDNELSDIPLVRTLKNSFASDYLKAIGVFLLPMYAPFLALSLVNQQCRLRCTPCGKRIEDRDKDLWLTHIASKQLEGIRQWPWSSVLYKVMVIGVLYFSFSVGVGKLTYIFLSYVNSQLASLDLGAVTVIFFLIGLTMFLLPPVPGAPVYLVGGVMLTKSAWKQWGGDNTAFWAGAFYTSAVCFILKLCAITGQQKGFGEQLGKKVAIRKAVGVNSITIRSIKMILTKPGLSIGKVSILIGGPDWPTSVLTGILRLSLPAMLFGSTPVIFLVTPTVLAGALMLRSNDGGIYSSLGSMFLALCALVQSLGLFAAMYYIEDTAAANYDKLKAEPVDKEVEAEELKDAQKRKAYLSVTEWGVLPGWQKFNLILGAAFTAGYCYMFGLFGSKCFESFNITDTIEDKLGGDVLNVVKPNKLNTGTSGFGWIGLGLFAICCVQMKIFGVWANGRVANGAAKGTSGTTTLTVRSDGASTDSPMAAAAEVKP